MDTRMIDEMNQELHTMRSLFTSPEWSIWAKFLKSERRGYLQNKINSAVESGNLVEAQIALALYKDCVKQIELFGRHIVETEKQIKGATNGK